MIVLVLVLTKPVHTVLQLFVFDAWKVPFGITVFFTIAFIWIYTFRSGIKTIVWTDTLQTFFMLLAVGLSLKFIVDDLDLGFSELVEQVKASTYSDIFVWDKSEKNFINQFLSGTFIAIVMTGLDQDMMQKNLTCRSLKEAKKNVISLGALLIVVNFVFLVLGALLYIYANSKNIAIPAETDKLFPTLAVQYFSPFAGAVFLIGLIAAAYSSADSALTSLTTAFCIDFLGFSRDKQKNSSVKTRYLVHLGFSFVLMMTIIIFDSIGNKAVIDRLFIVAGYTYGPLLGMFSFGILSKRKVRDRWVPLICLVSPVLCYFIDQHSEQIFGGFKIGYLLLILNGALTYIGMMLISKK